MVSSHTDDPALVKNNNAVGGHYRADALGDDELGLPRGAGLERVAQLAVRFEVERGEGIVENKYLRVAAQGARDGKA